MSEQVAFLVQLVLILGSARLFGEVMRRLGQPPVLGELLAGIVLGPSLLGWAWPDAFHTVFADRRALDVIATVGLVLLMLLTGLETDIRVMRNMGRAAFMASAFGMLIPFALGLVLGLYLDERFVLKGRPILALFLATAMAVSAMPVIAKILLDLNMMKRNVGILVLSASVVDDTIGWIVLAAISGLAMSGSFDPHRVLVTLGMLAAFLAAAAWVLHPGLRWLLPRVEHAFRLPGGELVLIVVVAFSCAAATEAMRVHAVFGAFVAGAILRQCPTLRAENLHQLEGFTLSLFAPIFFGAIGLRVDLTTLEGFYLPWVVIALAIAGKLVGCFVGGMLGRLSGWESFALGLGMSARGAVGLIVAKIGLDLGIVDRELFSILVLMAIATSFFAPAALKAILSRLPMSEEERLREKGAPEGFVPTGRLKVLVPAAGGPNALVGCHLAAHLCSSDGDRCIAFHVERSRPPWWRRLRLGADRERRLDTDAYIQRLQAAAGPYVPRLSWRAAAASGSVLDTILAETEKGYQFLVIGASGHGHPVYDPFISEVVKRTPCHLVVVSGARESGEGVKPFRRVLVPTNGSYYADAAFDFAARYAEATGARLDVLYVAESRQQNPLLPAAALSPGSDRAHDLMRSTLRQQYAERFRHPERLECRVRESESVVTGLIEEVLGGRYDLVVFGAENKSLVERLYLGQSIEAVITELPCAVALVIPKVTGAARG